MLGVAQSQLLLAAQAQRVEAFADAQAALSCAIQAARTEHAATQSKLDAVVAERDEALAAVDRLTHEAAETRRVLKQNKERHEEAMRAAETSWRNQLDEAVANAVSQCRQRLAAEFRQLQQGRRADLASARADATRARGGARAHALSSRACAKQRQAGAARGRQLRDQVGARSRGRGRRGGRPPVSRCAARS